MKSFVVAIMSVFALSAFAATPTVVVGPTTPGASAPAVAASAPVKAKKAKTPRKSEKPAEVKPEPAAKK